MRTPESYEKTDIKKYLDSIGAWYFLPFMAAYGKSGVPDIIACVNGKFWSIEVKRPGKEPTPRQQKRMEEIRLAGGVAVWGDAARVIEQLKAIHG